ncbi:uncharacterized protein Dvar_08510 [Desulfosarcina variabilis str. Montpellier]|uniref:hypothetical protein n=1 Tax=Desulfosarcina variabilis TaxID=2300 RepID=UPI003AFB2198
MKIIGDSLSVIIVGKWNRYILTPEWVAEKIFNNEELEVQLPINRPELAPRYKSPDNIFFLPAVHKCQFMAQEPHSDEKLARMSSCVRSLVTILEHTPVTALGVNIVFEEESHNFDMLELFDLADSDRCAEAGLSTNKTEIKRQFSFENHVLNLNIIYTQDKVLFDFNYHYEVTGPAQIAELVTDDLIISKKTQSLDILNKFYGLELDDNEEGES